MGLANFVVLAWLYFAFRYIHASDECFGSPEYICDGKSSKKTCDCKEGDTCYFKFVLEDSKKQMNEEIDQIITVNGLFQGPTLILKSHATVVVDLVNNMKEETSIHWHGMHQYNVPWMDGVGNITQWGIQPGRKFRYIFEAKPSGTFWYHSHVDVQRTIGLFGALIVKEIPAPVFPGIDGFEDKPEEHTLVFLDFARKNPTDFDKTSRRSTKKTAKVQVQDTCYPDGSKVTQQKQFVVPVLNGVELPENDAEAVRRRRSASPSHPQISTYFVQKGKTYRFRLVGAMQSSAYRFSIDSHKLIVVATDGYLVEPFETDYIIIHSGERYDFLLNAAQKDSVQWYLMRVETLAMDCISKEPLQNSGLALLGYDDSSSDKFLENCNSNGENPRGCTESAPCTVMNCPFEAYKASVGLVCHHVDELKLLYETPAHDIPDSEKIVPGRTWFFDFEYARFKVATVNDKQFEFPHMALQVSDYSGEINECDYDKECSSPEDTNQCVQIVNIPDEHFKRSVRFVLSSLGGRKATSFFIHPIHLHGHSFHVVKFGYPTYFENGMIDKPSQDLRDSQCGQPSWKHDRAPGNIKATSKTVRKDTINVPAGGYVVIEFRADNPGYWFLHCHIDSNLINGMGAVIRELKGYQNLPPPHLTVINKDFCWTVEEFREKKNYLSSSKATSDNPATLQDKTRSAEPHSKEGQAELAKQIINRRKNLKSMIEKDEVLKDQPDSRISWKDPRAAWRLKQAESAPFMDRWERRFKGKVHASKERSFLSDWNFRLRKKGSAEHK